MDSRSVIRRATAQDVPFIVSVCRVAYCNVPLNYNDVTAWLFKAVRSPEILCFVSDNGFAIAHLTKPFYARPQLTMAFLACRGSKGLSSEGYRLLKTMVDCAWAVGADFFFSSEIGSDLSPLASRLGAKVSMTPTFRVEWNENAGHHQRRAR